MITGRLYSNIFILYLEHAVKTTMTWYIAFRGQKPRVYDSWGVYSEYIVGFSGATFQSYSIRMQVEKAHVTFLDHQDKLRKSEQVAQKSEDVVKKCCWKDWVILAQCVVITVIWYKIM
jgi:viroplasmin and RNaseH domain-containing protein